MPDGYQLYDMSITVLSPVYIGTGQILHRREFVLGRGCVHVIDANALTRRVMQSTGLAKLFESFCLNRQARLSDFLWNNRIPVGEVTRYTLPLWGDQHISRFMPFIKTSGHLPYLPGSSIKGALRTVMLRHYASTTGREAAVDGVQQAIEEMEGRLERAGTERRRRGIIRRAQGRADDLVERAYFGQDQHHDWMRCIEIEDTAPLAPEDLALSEVQVASLDTISSPNRLRPKRTPGGYPIRMHPEILRPTTREHTTRLRGRMRIGRHLLSAKAAPVLGFEGGRLALSAITQACNDVAQESIAQETGFAQKANWKGGRWLYKERLSEELGDLGENTCLLRVGWGTGFDAKTVTDQLGEDIFDRVRKSYHLRVGKPSRSRDYLPMALSPKSRKVASMGQEPRYPLGWVRIAFKERT